MGLLSADWLIHSLQDLHGAPQELGNPRQVAISEGQAASVSSPPPRLSAPPVYFGGEAEFLLHL